MSEPSISFDQVCVRHDNQVLFDKLNIQIGSHEHWGILGPSGSGKSAFLKLLARKFPIAKGNYHWKMDAKRIAFLTSDYHFKNKSGLVDFFYQQRFNSTITDDAPTVERLLFEANSMDVVPANTMWTPEKVIELLDLRELLDEEVIKLSNGETKRLRLATLLLKNPLLLLLDTPMVGLDQATRITFENIFKQIAGSGIQLIMTLDPDEIPEVITHAFVLENRSIEKTFSREHFNRITIHQSASSEVNNDLLSRVLNEQLPSFDQVIQMKNVNIRYDSHQILSDINWEVRQGDRWALLGPNGAGKSTLLSLINGDNPQAYANDIILFDRPRGSGETIWDLKKKIGYVSPELLHYFRTNRTCYEVIRSGLREGSDLQPLVKTQIHKIDQWIELLGLESQREIQFRSASPTAQRLSLIARALVKDPILLILDEPCQGLDREQTNRIVEILDEICLQSSMTLIYVTHYLAELPKSIDHIMELANGHVVSTKGR